MIRRLLPHPLLSLCLLLGWVLLVDDFSFGHWLLGAMLGLALPLLCRDMLLAPLRIRRPGLLLRFIGLVLYDIVMPTCRSRAWCSGPPASYSRASSRCRWSCARTCPSPSSPASSP